MNARRYGWVVAGLALATGCVSNRTVVPVDAEIKDLVRLAAERERRSVASMIEILVLSYAEQHALQKAPKPTKSKASR